MVGVSMSVLLCLLCVLSQTYANSPPSVDQTFYEVCEDTPVGEAAFTIQASDADADKLTFEITGTDNGYFVVDRNTGVVTVRRQLTIQGDEFVLSLAITVSDGTISETANLAIFLKDANNNRPLFEDGSFAYSFPENTPVDTSLFRVKASDEDTGFAGVVRYSIDEVTPHSGSGLFSINNVTGDVNLTGNLNYNELSASYRLKINASDSGGNCYSEEVVYLSNTAFYIITVVDLPDLDPEFLNLPTTRSIEEHSPVGTPIIEVSAIDPDAGINDKLSYSIEDSPYSSLFKISEEGILSVASDIDREGDDMTSPITLTVKVTESNLNIDGVFASATAEVQINIIDINDNVPEFYKCGPPCVKETNFTEEISENTFGSIQLNMIVSDLDQISSTKLTLGGADKDVFSVEPESTSIDSVVRLIVREPQKLDYEQTQQMTVEVIATDQFNTDFESKATVTINLLDTNDNSPSFQNNTYRLSVPEHSEDGTEVGHITAEDPDTMDQGKLVYSLLPDSILPYFDVHNDSGIIYVKNKALLDREVRALYSATLEAKDTDGKPGTTVLEITLLDINDQPPVINREFYQEFLREGEQLQTRIEATDADDPDTDNSKIVYKIEDSKYSDNFTIDPDTGVLRNSGELDREDLDLELDGRIEIHVTATDKGVPPLSTSVLVIINVQDVNDNTPEFYNSSYEFSVKEGEQGAFVGSVTAVDLDQTPEFNRISFSIIDGSFGSFIIRAYPLDLGYHGNITVDPEINLDYESNRKQFKLRVQAADLEQESAETMVTVNVLDVNDERPVFLPIEPVSVKENTTITEVIGQFLGYDVDTNHSLIYELESVKCSCNTTVTPCSYFFLLPSGEVTVNNELKIDYEECHQVQIEAQVVDMFTEKGENNSATPGVMVINIEDINDNAPEFNSLESVFVVVSETASLGTSVASVTATDKDSGTNRQLEFKVSEVLFQSTNNQTSDEGMPFEAITTQQNDEYVGIIQTKDVLELTLKGKYLVTVTATDKGGLSTAIVLEIFSIDQSYRVELEFTLTVEQVEERRDDIIRALQAATQTAVYIVKTRPNTEETTRETTGTIIEAYFVYSNGTALIPDEVGTMISDPEHYLTLVNLGLKNIGTAPLVTQSDTLTYVLFGIVGGLIVVLAILTTSLLCTRRNYRRKLKAAKAMNSAATVNSDNQKSGAVVPGTNKYTMEGANPVLNLNIHSTLALDLDEDSSDVDKVSLNSFDYREDMDRDKDSKPAMKMIREDDEEEVGNDEPPMYIEPLDAVLAQRGQKKGTDNPLLGYNNPAFSTTDL